MDFVVLMNCSLGIYALLQLMRNVGVSLTKITREYGLLYEWQLKTMSLISSLHDASMKSEFTIQTGEVWIVLRNF